MHTEINIRSDFCRCDKKKWDEIEKSWQR